MNLGHLIASENGLADEEVLLLRHGNVKLNALLKFGATIEECTLIQPNGSKYDFWRAGKPKIRAVVVIAFDAVHAVYLIKGVRRTGTTHNLGSAPFTAFDIAMGYPAKPAVRFAADTLPSRAMTRAVLGWTSPRNAVARFGGRLFQSVEV